MLTDLLLSAWLTGVAAVLVFVVGPRLLALRRADPVLRFADTAGILALIVVLGVAALSDGHLLNWFTLMLVCATPLLGRWVAAYDWSIERAIRETTRNMAIASTHLLETGSVPRRIGAAATWQRDRFTRRARRAAASLEDPSYSTIVFIAIVSAAAAVTIYLRYAPVLGTVRLGSPDAYAILLQARQALHNQPAELITPITAALAAALALATSLNPMHVVRLMGPLVGIVMVGAAAILARRIARSAAAGAAVLWILGGCTFAIGREPATGAGPWWVFDRTLARHWAVNDGTTALLFLILAGIGLEAWRDERRRAAALHRRFFPSGAAACLAVAAMASPVLLVLLVPAALSPVIPRHVRLFTLSALWAGIGLAAARQGASDLAFSLPVAVAFLAAATCVLAAQVLGRIARTNLQPAVASALVLITLALLPPRAGALYLEHEITADKTLEIASSFPRGRWLIVAPVEQLAETYGRGWFEDPATFIAKHATHVDDPAFRFEMAVDDLFVLVERRPFKTFGSEAYDVPFSTLGDPSYRQYRSLAGRATLQAQLYALCEAYTRTHRDASIYYEDAQITIYRFRPRA